MMRKAVYTSYFDTNLRKQLRKGLHSAAFFVLFLFTSTLSANAQQAGKVDACATPNDGYFNFLIGKWRGEERASEAKSSTVISTSEVEITQILGGCALQESWQVQADGKKLFSAILLRAYDAKSHRWMLSYIDDGQNFQIYEGLKDKDGWSFYRERIANGKTVRIKITWKPYEKGFTQTVERSTDGGQTWSLGAIITYSRIK